MNRRKFLGLTGLFAGSAAAITAAPHVAPIAAAVLRDPKKEPLPHVQPYDELRASTMNNIVDRINELDAR